MPDNNQTAEQLQKQLEETQAQLDKLFADPESTEEVEETTETPEETTDEEETTEEPVVTEETENKEEETTEEPEITEETTEEEVKPSVEERYKESSTEARKLSEDTRKINDAFHEAHNLNDVSDEELRTEFPEFDSMSETEKLLARKNLINEKRFAILESASAERRVVDEWNDKVDIYIENPKTLIHNPDLEGKGERFKDYAKSKDHRNINFDVLVKSFLYDTAQNKIEHKGKMFETGQGGDKGKIAPKDDRLSIEEGARLMKTNYKKYVELLTAGKIKNE